MNMSVGFSISYFPSCHFRLLLVVVALLRLCLSYKLSNDVLCVDVEREALVEFKHGLIDEADRLASWVAEKNNDCCNWSGIECDNITGHVHKIHLSANCLGDYLTSKEYDDFLKRRLRGDLSPSLLNLKQLKHLDLSCNDFGGIQVPRFMGSLRNLRYLNLSRSGFGGTIPSQLGNLSELRTLCLGSFYHDDDTDEYESTRISSMQWLSSIHQLHHLDMSGVNLSKAINWLQVINTLPSLVELHLSSCQLTHAHPRVSTLNLTSLSLLDLSGNDFGTSLFPQWVFSITSLVSLDLSFCDFVGPITSHSNNYRNLTSLKLLHVHGNGFMNSPLVLKGLSNVGSNLISLDISSCGVSSSVLNTLHNLTSLRILEMSGNGLTTTIPRSLGNLCNMRRIYLANNNFQNISITLLLESFFECKSPSLESLSLESSRLSSHLPYQLGQLKNLVTLQLEYNRIAGIIPDSIGRLSSLEVLRLSHNRLNGSLPGSLGLLSRLETLDLSYNQLTGGVTEAHFANLNKLKYLNGIGNNLTLRPHLENWIPSFQLKYLYLSSWDLGPQFPLWLLKQRGLERLEIRNTRISSTMPLSFWKSFPNLKYLDMSQNYIQGRLSRIPSTLVVLDVSSNKFMGKLPELSNNSMTYILDVSHNSFGGSLHQMLCPYGGKWLEVLNLENNHLSGVIPECWEKYPNMMFLNLENNNFSGQIPITLGSLLSLGLLNLCNNKLLGRLPTSLKNLKELSILQVARNKLVGQIPAWLGTELSSLRILNLRSNNFDGLIPDELCYLEAIQILDLAHNNLSGNIPRCFNNFTVLSMKEVPSIDGFFFMSYDDIDTIASASLVIKGREDTYNTILGLVMILDLSSNNLSGAIPSNLTALHALQSLNLSRNNLTGIIPDKIGDLKSLASLDVSFNRLSGGLPVSLSSLNFLSSFNVSYNNLAGRVPSSTQLQSFNESSFFGNKLCGDPLVERCANEVSDTDQEEDDGSHGPIWDLIVSSMLGFIVGFWVVLAPLIVSAAWRTTYFHFLSDLKYIFCNIFQKCRGI